MAANDRSKAKPLVMPPEKRYRVFKVKDGPIMSDPDVPGPRYHTVIFVETNADGSGYVHHVTGDLVKGMEYQRRPGGRPEDSETFYQKPFLGTVSASSYPESVNKVCKSLPAPPPQKSFNLRTMKTEPIKPDGSFCQPGESRSTLIKYTEWTEEHAIPALQQAHVNDTQNMLLLVEREEKQRPEREQITRRLERSVLAARQDLIFRTFDQQSRPV